MKSLLLVILLLLGGISMSLPAQDLNSASAEITDIQPDLKVAQKASAPFHQVHTKSFGYSWSGIVLLVLLIRFTRE